MVFLFRILSTLKLKTLATISTNFPLLFTTQNPRPSIFHTTTWTVLILLSIIAATVTYRILARTHSHDNYEPAKRLTGLEFWIICVAVTLTCGFMLQAMIRTFLEELQNILALRWHHRVIAAQKYKLL
jgi:hypothetical protein